MRCAQQEGAGGFAGRKIGRLAGNFNAMTMELAASRRRMERLTEGLERQVAAKTAEVRRTEGRLAQAEEARRARSSDRGDSARDPQSPDRSRWLRAAPAATPSPPDTEKDYARIVVAEATRLENLLKDVLDFSRPARFELRRQSLVPIVRESLAAFGERCAEHKITVEAALAAGETGLHRRQPRPPGGGQPDGECD